MTVPAASAVAARRPVQFLPAAAQWMSGAVRSVARSCRFRSTATGYLRHRGLQEHPAYQCGTGGLERRTSNGSADCAPLHSAQRNGIPILGLWLAPLPDEPIRKLPPEWVRVDQRSAE